MIINLDKYDGHLLHHRFAYRYFGHNVNPLGDIVAFRGEMEVLAEGMLDLEDIMAEAFIWSEDAINFAWEIPMLGQDGFGAVAYQHLLNTHIARILATFINKPISMNGDDMMVEDDAFAAKCGKASVSITYVKEGAALGHTGINVKAGERAPMHAYSTYLSNQQAQQFMQQVIEAFYTLNQDLFVATAKVRG